MIQFIMINIGSCVLFDLVLSDKNKNLEYN